ncbi:MAG: glycosyltransferase family 4 protein [Halocynthiibacter sp.]
MTRPLLLDITRLLSRVDRPHFTGVDRVEFQYLQQFLNQEAPLFLIAKSRLGYKLFDRKGAVELHRRLSRNYPWGTSDWISRLSKTNTPLKAQAEADTRRLAVHWGSIKSCLRKLETLSSGSWQYFNVAHSNLGRKTLRAMAGHKVTIFIHDTIPLDFPDLQPEGVSAAFRAKLTTVGRFATEIICNSHATKKDIQTHLSAHPANIRVAPLGIETSLAQYPAAAAPYAAPFFVTVGTIEPRKNHMLLLKIWQDLVKTHPAEDIPKLIIIGARGWKNEDVFQILDTDPMMGRHVIEAGAVDDQALSVLLRGAQGLLFPSLAEGFGLPPAEAISLGTAALCGDLPVYREFLGKKPVYLEVNNPYLWKETILELATIGKETAAIPVALSLPTWDAHFKIVNGQ